MEASRSFSLWYRSALSASPSALTHRIRIVISLRSCSNHGRRVCLKCERSKLYYSEDGLRLIGCLCRYFRKANICFPLLDKMVFRNQYTTAKDHISPALLSSLYAHSLVYWKADPELASQRAPDGRFVWNLATEALHSELFVSPGISTITALLLNIGGRPTTALIGNGVRLGSAVSLAYSLGLNHDPLSWDISQSEKMLRMHIWWALLIQDRWYGCCYGFIAVG